MTDPTLATGIIVLILLPTIAYLIKRQIDTIEIGGKQALDAEVLNRGAMATALRGEIAAVYKEHRDLQREVDKDYVSYDRLTVAMQPLNKTMEEMKQDQQRLFQRLDGKQDKGGHHD